MKHDLRTTLEGYLETLKASRQSNEQLLNDARNQENYDQMRVRQGRVLELGLAISEVDYMLKVCG